MTPLADEASRQRRLAQAHVDAAREATQKAEAYDRGEVGERSVRALLASLEDEGWFASHGRHWPGTRRADLDHVVVGPGGVFVLDSKALRGDVRVAGGRLWQGQADRSDEVEGMHAQLAAVEDVLGARGLAPAAVTGALVLVDHEQPLVQLGRVHVLGERHLIRWLRSRGRRLSAAEVDELRHALDAAVPAHRAPAATIAVVRQRPRPRAPAGQGELFPTQQLDLAELERASRLPLEEWMTWLHPAQLEVVRRSFNGPSRVRGSAGCGKTVVALHRAAYLAAREPGDVLFLSYVKTLPVVLETLFGRLAPEHAARVQFRSLHSTAYDVLSRAGVPVRLDPVVAETCFSRAWGQVGRQHLEQYGLPLEYWREEVSGVVKGRGLQDWEDYAGLTRTGRRTPLSAEQRRRVWDLYIRYQELLEERRVHDFGDLVSLALEVARAGGAPAHRFVFVDEAQDLDLQAVRLAAALVTDERDGLTLVGDGQQSLYAGGYTLKEAGVSVTGRSTVLATNYRNTRQVLEVAQRVVDADEFDDLEDLAEPGRRDVVAVRDGALVLQVAAHDVASAEVALLRQVQSDLALGLPAASAAVLCRTIREATRVQGLLRGAGIAVLGLEDYDGTPQAAVKVGTVKRAKGLEFGRVYVPRLDSWLVEEGAAEQERVQRERRELFVAMTRARDGLWLCRVSPPA